MDDQSLKLENQLCFPLYAAARQVVGAYTPFLKPLGLTYTQYITMMILWEKHAVSVKELCQMLRLDTGTLTPMLKKMEEAGYLTRARKAEDERVVIVTISDQGMALKDHCMDIPKQVGKCVSLSPEEAYSLYQILYKILNSGQDNAQ